MRRDSGTISEVLVDFTAEQELKLAFGLTAPPALGGRLRRLVRPVIFVPLTQYTLDFHLASAHAPLSFSQGRPPNRDSMSFRSPVETATGSMSLTSRPPAPSDGCL
jgi:hypothetical protein